MSPDSHQHGGSFAFSARAQAPHDHFCRVGKHSRRTQCRAQVREQVPDAGVQRPFLAQTYRSRHVAGQKRIQLRRDLPGRIDDGGHARVARPDDIPPGFDCPQAGLRVVHPDAARVLEQESLVDTASS